MSQITNTGRYLRSPDSGTLGQGVRFVVAGGVVTLIYLTTTMTLAQGPRLPFQVALAVGFITSLVAHFSLQRFFVWVTRAGYALAFRAQLRRYLSIAGSQYAASVAITSTLPGELGASTTDVYLAWTVMWSIASFLIFRSKVFHTNGQLTARPASNERTTSELRPDELGG